MLLRMKLLDDERNAIDLSTTPLHLGLGSRARPIDGFAFDPTVLQAYGDAVAEDGIEGRMVVLIDEEGPGDHWERHPAGDEVIVCVSGTVTAWCVTSGSSPSRSCCALARPLSTRPVCGMRWTWTGPRAS